jgi:anti-sigma factor RsiW
MNEATLERLMMDRALGALPADVEELLMEHLRGDEGKVREAEEMKEMMGRAREAISAGECRAQPELRIAQRLRRERVVAWGGRVAAMAACLAVGMFIARLGPERRRDQVVVQKQPSAPNAIAVNDARVGEGELWSAQRIYRNAIEANRSERPGQMLPRGFQ